MLRPSSYADRRPRAVWVLVILAFALVASACGSSNDRTERGQDDEAKGGDVGIVEESGEGIKGGKIVYGLTAETDGWNPTTSRWASSGLEVARAVFDTLSAYDADGTWKPNLAESFTPNETSTVWEVKLRPDVTFHNGDPLDADAVKANMDYHIASPLTGETYDPVEKVESDGDLTVTVTMKQPWTNWPYAMATQVGVIAEPDWLLSNDTRKPIGTGPFVFREWEPDRSLKVVRNENWWREGLPYLDEVEFRPIADPSSRSQALQSGDINIMQTTSAAQIVDFAEKAEDGEFQVFNDIVGETSEVFVQLNTMAPPFDDRRAREILAYATDKQSFIDTLHEGLYLPANGPFAPGSPWYVETPYPQFDPTKARELLAAYQAEKGPLSFEILSPADPLARQNVQALIDQWSDVGIDVKARDVQQADQILQVLTGNYEATMWQQFDSPHPLGDSIWWHPNAAKDIPEFSLNFARNRSEVIGQHLDEARETPDPEREAELYGLVSIELAEDIPYIWLYHSQISVVARNNVVNVTNWTLPDGSKGLPIQGGSHPLFQVWLKPNGDDGD